MWKHELFLASHLWCFLIFFGINKKNKSNKRRCSCRFEEVFVLEGNSPNFPMHKHAFKSTSLISHSFLFWKKKGKGNWGLFLFLFISPLLSICFCRLINKSNLPAFPRWGHLSFFGERHLSGVWQEGNSYEFPPWPNAGRTQQ